MYKITALMDNYTGHPECIAEYGLSFLVETPDNKILFDTGQTERFINNAAELNVDLKSLDFLVLSHGHFDHTGGLKGLLTLNNDFKIIAHPALFTERYSKSTGENRNVSIPFTKEELEKVGAKFHFTDEPYIFSPSVLTTGEITANAGNPSTANLYKKSGDRLVKDDLKDDLSMIIKHNEQINIICGCSHAGNLNIVEQAINLTGLKTINYIIGGLHLYGMDKDELNDTLYELNKFDIRNMALSHCTGVNTLTAVSDNMASSISYFGIGNTIVIQ